jgi:hypothetical protein
VKTRVGTSTPCCRCSGVQFELFRALPLRLDFLRRQEMAVQQEFVLSARERMCLLENPMQIRPYCAGGGCRMRATPRQAE